MGCTNPHLLGLAHTVHVGAIASISVLLIDDISVDVSLVFLSVGRHRGGLAMCALLDSVGGEGENSKTAKKQRMSLEEEEEESSSFLQQGD